MINLWYNISGDNVIFSNIEKSPIHLIFFSPFLSSTLYVLDILFFYFASVIFILSKGIPLCPKTISLMVIAELSFKLPGFTITLHSLF